jgi:hypothetical protein
MGMSRSLVDFDPDMIARLEATGWKAYYARDWTRAFVLLVRMLQEQAGIPFPRSVLAAYYFVRAEVLFAPQDNAHRLDGARECLRQCYALAAAANNDAYDPATAAARELDYWIVHRELSNARDPDKTRLVDALAALHAVVFGGSPEIMRPSAEHRTIACNHVDEITSRRSPDPEEDWRRAYFHLRRCYEQVKAAAPVE